MQEDPLGELRLIGGFNGRFGPAQPTLYSSIAGGWHGRGLRYSKSKTERIVFATERIGIDEAAIHIGRHAEKVDRRSLAADTQGYPGKGFQRRTGQDRDRYFAIDSHGTPSLVFVTLNATQT